MPDYYVNPGDLRTLVTFQMTTLSADTGGAQIPGEWEDVETNPTVWARWINAHGQEAITNEVLKTSQRATVTIRYRSDVLTSWRLLNNGEPWQIISIDQVQGRRRWTELIVERSKGTL